MPGRRTFLCGDDSEQKTMSLLYSSEQNPSEFLLEIRKNIKMFHLCGNWFRRADCFGAKRMSVCGFPMQLRYKPAYGLRLYISSNEQEMWFSDKSYSWVKSWEYEMSRLSGRMLV